MNALVPMLPSATWFGWSDEAVGELKRLCAEGWSASQIAAALGVATRNAVIGKAVRLGITLHGKQTNGRHLVARINEYPRGASGTARKAPSPVNPDQDLRSRSALTLRPVSTRSHQRQSAPMDAPSRAGQGRVKRIFNLAPKTMRWVDRDVPAPCSIGVTILDLAETACKWPHGDPSDLGVFRYCGAQAEAERPYCPHHCGLAYVGTASPFAKATERNTWLMKA